MADDKAPDFSFDQIREMFEKNVAEGNKDLQHAKSQPPAFKSSEGVEEVPAGNDDALDD